MGTTERSFTTANDPHVEHPGHPALVSMWIRSGSLAASSTPRMVTAGKPTSSSHVPAGSVSTGALQVRVAEEPFDSGSPYYSGRSLSAHLGTTNDMRKIGVILRPWHRKLMTWPSVT